MAAALDLNGPWSLEPRGQLRDKDGDALASFPIYPGGLGGPEDRRNGELCALLPELLAALVQLVDSNEGVRGPLLAEAKAVLQKVEAVL